MNCPQIRDVLPLLLCGDLPPDEAVAVRKHLAGCPACQGEHAALQQLRGVLDTLPVPAVQVDLPRLYQEANLRQEKQLRRWRRAALGVFGVAAALLLALGLNLELRVEGHQLVLRWGSPPEPPRPQAPPEVRPQTVVTPGKPEVTAEEMRLVKKLIHALAADVEARDQQQREALRWLQARLETLREQNQKRWLATARDVSALYTAQFGSREKGERQ
jgi:anti-sigma factor RsiW